MHQLPGKTSTRNLKVIHRAPIVINPIAPSLRNVTWWLYGAGRAMLSAQAGP